MPKSFKPLIVFFIFFGFISCVQKRNANSIVLDWIGKRIHFEQSFMIYDPNSDSLSIASKKTYINKLCKLIIYIDAECMTCAEDLIKWSQIKKEFQENNIDLVFFIHTNDLNTLKPYLKKWRFDSKFIVDKENAFFYKNELSNEKILQAMLLDDNDRIIVIGNPVYNEDFITLYKNAMNSINKNDF